MLVIWKWRADDQKDAASRSEPIHCIISAFVNVPSKNKSI
jgi:hypothetical protein